MLAQSKPAPYAPDQWWHRRTGRDRTAADEVRAPPANASHWDARHSSARRAEWLRWKSLRLAQLAALEAFRLAERDAIASHLVIVSMADMATGEALSVPEPATEAKREAFLDVRREAGQALDAADRAAQQSLRKLRLLDALCAHGKNCHGKAAKVIRQAGGAPGHCPVCGRQAKVQADHIQPLAQGGLDCRDNLGWLCPSCNSDKSDLSLDEWAADVRGRLAYIKRRSMRTVCSVGQHGGCLECLPCRAYQPKKLRARLAGIEALVAAL